MARNQVYRHDRHLHNRVLWFNQRGDYLVLSLLLAHSQINSFSLTPKGTETNGKG